MGYAISKSVVIEMYHQDCAECGRQFGFMESWRAKMQERGGSIYCPYCRTSHGYNDTELDKLRRDLEAEKRRHQETLARENEERQAKAKLERKLRRVDNGVCPECKRNFQNLARHMACKHNKAVPFFGKRKIP